MKSRHIGKWAVLCERWPALALAISEDPSLMVELESASTYDKAIQRTEAGHVHGEDRELSEFCLSPGEIRLADVIRRIVQCAPAEDSPY